MKIEDYHKDVHKALVEDEKYQQILNTLSDDEKKGVEDFMKRFMSFFQEKLFNPLINNMENEPDFKDALNKKISDLIPNKDKE